MAISRPRSLRSSLGGSLQQVHRRAAFAVPENAAADLCRGPKQPHESQRGGAFPGAGFAHQAEHFALVQAEADAAHRLRCAKTNSQVGHFKQRRHEPILAETADMERSAGFRLLAQSSVGGLRPRNGYLWGEGWTDLESTAFPM